MILHNQLIMHATDKHGLIWFKNKMKWFVVHLKPALLVGHLVQENYKLVSNICVKTVL